MRKSVAVLAAALLIAAAGAPVLAKTETVTGQVIDLACYFLDKANTTNVHKGRGYACAQACAREGFQVGLLTSDGKVYELTGGLAASKNARLVAHMGHTISVTGDSGEKDGFMTLAANDLKMVKE